MNQAYADALALLKIKNQRICELEAANREFALNEAKTTTGWFIEKLAEATAKSLADNKTIIELQMRIVADALAPMANTQSDAASDGEGK